MGSERVFLTVSIKNSPPGGERRRGEKEKRRRGKKNITRAEAESRARPKAEVPFRRLLVIGRKHLTHNLVNDQDIMMIHHASSNTV